MMYHGTKSASLVRWLGRVGNKCGKGLPPPSRIHQVAVSFQFMGLVGDSTTRASRNFRDALASRAFSEMSLYNQSPCNSIFASFATPVNNYLMGTSNNCNLGTSWKNKHAIPSQLSIGSKQFSATATVTDVKASNSSSDENNNKKSSKEGSKKDDSNIFLDNLGKIFLSTIGIVLLMLLRSTRSNNSRLALREDIELSSILDPMEIDDLRAANSEFNLEVWETIVEELKMVTPNGKATYPEFLSVVVRVMRKLKGEEFTIQLGHLLDRVVISELERSGGGDFAKSDEEEKNFDGIGGGGEDSTKQGSKIMETELPLSFLLATLSLALHGTVADRIRVLYDAMLLSSSNEVTNDKMDPNDEQLQKNKLVPGKEVCQMIQHLQNTCQLVPDSQIVETDSKIPYQTFRVGTGAELTERARKGYGGKEGGEGVTKAGEGPVSLEEFHAILKSRAVCAWGECYVKKAGAMATSDK